MYRKYYYDGYDNVCLVALYVTTHRSGGYKKTVQIF